MVLMVKKLQIKSNGSENLQNIPIIIRNSMLPRTSKARIQEVLTAILALYPDKQIELIYETPFQLLIAVMLSAQTTDKQVNKVTPEFFALVREPENLIGWDIKKIESYLSRVNFYHNKCANILKTAAILRWEFDSVIPKTIEKIITLPWVGIKTAKVVLSHLYDLPYIGVDTHIHRVFNRLKLCKTKTPEETDKWIEKHLWESQKSQTHHAIVLFGRYMCTARNPRCYECSLASSCPSKREY